MHTSEHPCDGSLMVVRVVGDVEVHVGGLAVAPCVQSGFASGHEYTSRRASLSFSVTPHRESLNSSTSRVFSKPITSLKTL